MGLIIKMGIPEMLELWTKLQTKHRDGTIKKKEEELYKKWGYPGGMELRSGSLI